MYKKTSLYFLIILLSGNVFGGQGRKNSPTPPMKNRMLQCGLNGGAIGGVLALSISTVTVAIGSESLRERLLIPMLNTFAGVSSGFLAGALAGINKNMQTALVTANITGGLLGVAAGLSVWNVFFLTHLGTVYTK